MRQAAIILIALVAVALTGCRTTRITETTTTATIVKDTTVTVVVPKDSARVDFTLPVVADSVKAPTVADTTIEVKSDLSKAVFTVKNGKASLKVIDGEGRKDSLKVTVKGAIRDSHTKSTREKVVEKKGWVGCIPIGLAILAILYLVFHFIPTRR